MVLKVTLCAFALLLAAHSATAHTYFRSSLVPFGDQAPDAPDSSAYLEWYTHQDVVHWNLNITDAANLAAVKLVYGNPDVTSEEVVTVLSFDPTFEGSDAFSGTFNATEFSPDYPWTVNGLSANIGLGHVWAVGVSPAAYHNTILSAPVEHFTPAGEA
ncbi:hypothetical protein ABPG77_010415 [Micractinium sp. CCAP 211/92]